MTAKNKDSLIGYDPLAWMNEELEAGQSPDSHEQASDTEALEQPTEELPETLVEAESRVEKQDLDSDETLETDDSIVEPVVAADSSKISLDASLNIHGVSELHAQLQQALQDNDALEIDASEVSTVDTASLQLLVILKQEAIKEGKALVFDFPSDSFIDAAKLLGIDDILGVDQAAAGFF